MFRHLLALALLVIFPVTVCAQSVPARDYLNMPVDNARFFLNLTNSASVRRDDRPASNLSVVEEMIRFGGFSQRKMIDDQLDLSGQR